MRRTFVLTFLLLGLVVSSPVTAQVKCSGVVQCAEALVSTTNRLAAENAALQKRMFRMEQQLQNMRQDQLTDMRKGGVRVPGSRNGYQETTIIFSPPFQTPPLVFLSGRDVNVRDHQQLWVRSISNDRAVIANCRRHQNPEGCLSYADDFHFDWIALRR